MRSSRRRPATLLAILLGICLVGLAITLNVGWIVLNWRELLPLVLGIPVTLLLIAGVVLNTIFLVREMRRNERQDSFLNAVTHELKTPIASIRLYLETLQRRTVPEEKRQDFYRIMLEDSDRFLAQQAVARALERNHLPPEAIVEDYASLPLLVNGNPDELQTALGNLIGNAVKYSPDGVVATVRVFLDEDGFVCFQISDHGMGIDPVHLKLIFRRFYRVPSRAVLKRQGTGLGLFLVRGIARHHGGSVSAVSQGEGLGATFTLRLPPMADTAAGPQSAPVREATQ